MRYPCAGDTEHLIKQVDFPIVTAEAFLLWLISMRSFDERLIY